MDLDLLPTFAAFADCLSFTETGARLGLTQPAVHGQVKRLAQATGDPLYQRRGRTLLLTPRGQALAAMARDVLLRRDAFLVGTQPLRLAAGRGAWTWLVVDRLADWLRTHGVQPLLAEGPVAEQWVRDGHAELGLSTAPPADLPSKPLWAVGTDLLVPLGHPLAERDRVRTRDLDGLTWILPSAGRPHRVVVEALFAQHSLTWQTAVTCDDWAVMARFVSLGLGIAAVNDCVDGPDVARVRWVDGPRHTYSVFWREARAPDALADLPSL